MAASFSQPNVVGHATSQPVHNIRVGSLQPKSPKPRLEVSDMHRSAFLMLLLVLILIPARALSQTAAPTDSKTLQAILEEIPEPAP